MQNLGSMRALPFLFLGSVLVSCICCPNLGFFHQTLQEETGAASTPETFTQTRGLSSNRLDIPRLMATFPSGAKIYLLSPQENAVVASPWVDVVGTAPAETVITFNEEITVAGADGFFRARVPLEEGPNEIQCLASDLEGNEVDFSLIVVFDPEG